MSYTAFKDCYAIETTYGSNSPNLNAAGDTGYLIGAMADEAEHPTPEFRPVYRAPGVGTYEVPAGNVHSTFIDRSGMWGFFLQNGIPLWMAQGTSSTAASVHTITPTALPSFTIQHERTGDATAWSKQFTGCMCQALTLYTDIETPLHGTLDWISQDGADPGFQLTNDPALPPTANTDGYYFPELTRTWDYGGGTPLAIDGLKTISIKIMSGLRPLLARYHDAGTDKSHIPRGYYEALRRRYEVEFIFHPATIETDIYDDFKARTSTKHLYLKWTRSATDYIEIELHDCFISSYKSRTPNIKELLLDTVILEPRAIAIDVKDSIAGGYYGE